MRKVAALVYKAKFEWRKVLGDLVRLKKPKVHLVDDGINIWTALFTMPGLPETRLRHGKLYMDWKGWRQEWKEWWSGSYSHIELWISDENGEFGGKEIEVICDGRWERTTFKPFFGHCFTSTMRDGMAGTVLRPASEVLTHPERWDIGIVGTVTEEQYESGMAWCRRAVEENKGYDKLCIADFFNPLRRWWSLHSKLKRICSEAFQGGIFAFMAYVVLKYICSPRRIVRILKKRGVVFNPVKGA